MNIVTNVFGNYSSRELKKITPIVDKIMALEDEMAELTDEELKGKTEVFKMRLDEGETLNDILVQAFAVVREASFRVLNMKHYREQLIGGIVLHQGRVAEMKTGEGKTLVSTCPGYLNALSGKGVHIVTVNDYLAQRDCEEMGQVYEFLGLKAGVVIQKMESPARREAYNCDVTYGTNSEFGFDYLRDNMVIKPSERVQRDLNFALIDEVDSVFIDEARTPLVISGQGKKSSEIYKVANIFAQSLKEEDDYVIDEKVKAIILTDQGVEKAEKYYGVENFSDENNMEIQHHTITALRANYVMNLGVDYIIREGEIMIVDQFTGRVMEGRRFNEGLHQAIESKEKVKIMEENDTLATITYQNYFKIYNKLSGMSGTVATEEKEFQEVYGLDVIEIPTHRPIARIDRKDRVFRTEVEKFKRVVEDIAATHKLGQPILVGTSTIDNSEILSYMLKKKGIIHEVLNAKEHQREAEIVKKAGKKGAITIATNMAGRGTDIKLEEDVEALGGLKIIGTERHESRRIDNQLRGRSGRQGDRGESIFYVSLEDEIVRRFGKERLEKIEKNIKFSEEEEISNKKIYELIDMAQTIVESHNFETRKNVVKYDEVLNKQRAIIYKQRNEVVEKDDIDDDIKTMIRSVINHEVDEVLSVGEEEEFEDNLKSLLIIMADLLGEKTISEDIFENFKDATIKETLFNLAMEAHEEKKAILGEELLDLEKRVLLKTVDKTWVDNIETLGNLKKYVALQAYNQKDPIVKYTSEGSEIFNVMVYNLKKQVVRYIMNIKVHEKESESIE
ncbi:MAG: preprotein translocase subunit SecA [Clostridium sp.]